MPQCEPCFVVLDEVFLQREGLNQLGIVSLELEPSPVQRVRNYHCPSPSLSPSFLLFLFV